MTAVEFRLLGPLEVLADGRPVRVPGAAERALLAVLLLTSGRSVPATSLVDRLWDDATLPVDPVNAVQLRVSKLRRVLAPHGVDVVREPAGYRIDAPPESVDVHRLARAVSAARAAARTTGVDAAGVLALYDEALALWRGGPLEEFAGAGWADVEAARLGQLHLAAVTERAETALTAGREAEVAADLAPVVAQDPAQEVLVALLMTALYRSGRQREALDVFATTRRWLADELGLRPSATLRTLHQRILRQDPGLGGARVLAPPAPTGAATARGTVLPAPATALIGRDDVLERVTAVVAEHRVVTLVGPGGAGKTSLALEMGRRLTRGSDRPARLVRLDAVTNPRDVHLAVAEAIGVPLDGADPTAGVRDRLLAYLANRRLLLVLDNCEHVVDAAAGLVDAIRSSAPDVVVLATSREALAVSGEVQVAVGPLDAPPPGSPPERVLDHPAAQLFVERARAVRPGWEPTETDLRAVGVICHGLDGMPLAVELAAARMSSLSPAEIAERLDDRFSLLTTGPRTAQTRQRTLRGAVEWSHALLGAPEQQVFRRLAVFQAGCTLTGAEAVVVGGDVRPADVLDLLGHLVERSMLVADPGSPTRYRMLETLRRYGLEQLDLAGETHETARRHATYVLELAEAAEPALRGRGQRSTLERLRAEHADLRAALDWLSAEPDGLEDALRLAGALGLYWHLGRHLEGRQVLRRLTEMPGGSPSARARALQAVSLVERPRACLVHPSPRCGRTAAQSLELFVGVGDLHRAALSRVLLAVELLDGSDPERFEELLTAAEEQFTADGDDWGHAVVGFVRLQRHLRAGDEARARIVGRSAAHAFRALDDGWGLSAVLYHLGWGLREFGRYADAVPVLERAVEVARAAGMHNTAQWALADLGVALLYLGELDAGGECFDRADAASDEIGDAAGQILAALGRGVLARIRGDVESARPLFRTALEGLHRLGTPLWAGQALAGIAWCDWREGLLDDAEQRYQDVRDAGERGGEPALVALGLEGSARIAVSRADRSSAGAGVARAAEIRRRAARPAPPHERAELAALDLDPQVQPEASDPAVTRA